MAVIMLGQQSAMCAIKVPDVPRVGDKVLVRKDMIEWYRSENAFIMVGDTFELTHRLEDFDTGDPNYGALPWFDIRNTRF